MTAPVDGATRAGDEDAGRTISVMVVDDRRAARTGLTLMVNRADDLRVIAWATNGRNALDQLDGLAERREHLLASGKAPMIPRRRVSRRRDRGKPTRLRRRGPAWGVSPPRGRPNGAPPGVLLIGGRAAEHPRHLGDGRPPAGHGQHEHHQVRSVDARGDRPGLLALDDRVRLALVVRPAHLLVRNLVVEDQRLPAKEADELGALAMVVVDAPRVLADVLGGERGHRHRSGDVRQLVAEHRGEQGPLVPEVVVDPFLVDPRSSGDPLDGRAVGPVLRELGRRRLHDPALGPLGVPCHAAPPVLISNAAVAVLRAVYYVDSNVPVGERWSG